jgi:hypothetical protein
MDEQQDQAMDEQQDQAMDEQPEQAPDEQAATGEVARPQRRNWDFILMMVTVGLLAALGIQSFVGTAYAWWAYRANPAWEVTGYADFVTTMNAVAAPLVIALVVVLGLCVPKRVLTATALAAVSVGMVAVGGVVWALTSDPALGLGAYLVVASVLQLVVVFMTAAGSPSLVYLTEGRLTRIGSGFLHLGFLLFALVVVVLQDSEWMLPVFFLSAVLTVVGTTMSFYSRSLVRQRPAE